MAKDNSLIDFLKDLGHVIKIRIGKKDIIPSQQFPEKILDFTNRRIDLKQIGFTKEQEDYYQNRFDIAAIENQTLINNWVDEANCEKKFASDHSLYYFPNVPMENTTNVKSMFSGCRYLEGVAKLNLSNCKSTNSLFAYCNMLYLLPEQWDTSQVTDFSWTFFQCWKLHRIPYIDLTSALDLSYMFDECNSLKKLPFPYIDLSTPKTMVRTFRLCYNLKHIIIKNSNLQTKSLNETFNGCSKLETITENNEEFQILSPVSTQIQYTFSGCYKLTTPIHIDAAKNPTLYGTFSGCNSLSNLIIDNSNKVTNWTNTFSSSNWSQFPWKIDLSGATVLSGVWSGCTNLEELLMPIDLTKVTTIYALFMSDHKLKKVILKNSKNSNKLIQIQYLFYNCFKLETITENNEPFELTSLRNINCTYESFINCYILTTPIIIDATNIPNMYHTFWQCQNLKSITLNNCQYITSWTAPFYNCLSLENLIITGWKNGNISLAQSKLLSVTTINNIIKEAETNTTARTLTLHIDVYNNWIDPNTNPEYDIYSQMAIDKGISIAK